jgi:hypothetical protein
LICLTFLLLQIKLLLFYFVLFFSVSPSASAETETHEWQIGRGIQHKPTRIEPLFYPVEADGYRCSACQHTRHRQNNKTIQTVAAAATATTTGNGYISSPFTRRRNGKCRNIEWTRVNRRTRRKGKRIERKDRKRLHLLQVQLFESAEDQMENWSRFLRRGSNRERDCHVSVVAVCVSVCKTRTIPNA